MSQRPQPTLKLWFRHHRWPLAIVLGLWGSYFLEIFWRLLRLKDTGLFIGNMSSWGDWALHVSLVNRFAVLDPRYWFSFHPYFADGAMTYPFGANLISGLLVKIGLALDFAMIWPSILTILWLILGLYIFYWQMFSSKAVSVVAIFLFFLSAGLGFLRLVDSSADLGNVWFKISELPDYSWYTSSVIDGMLIPQRAFLLGLTVSIWALVLFIYARRHNHMKLALASGLMVGMLPIVHPHSAIALVTIGAIWFLRQPQPIKIWLALTIPAVLLGGGLYWLFIASGIQVPLIRFEFGWTAKSIGGWLGQWLWQWGLTLPIAVIGSIKYWRSVNGVAKSLIACFWGLFAVANIWQFQPVPWDNSKLFLWVYLGLCPVVAFTLANWWRENNIWRWIVAVATVVLTLTGLIECYRLQIQLSHPLEISNSRAIMFGRKIADITQPTERFATAPIHNHPITLWGVRPILLGYPGWVWNYGFDYQAVERDLEDLYTQPERLHDIVRRRDISFVVVGPDERQTFPAINLERLEQFNPIYRDDLYAVYDVRSILK